MLSFFKRLAESEAETKQARGEAKFYLECLTTARNDFAALQKRFDAELKANRRREDELTAIIISQSAPLAKVPMPREFEHQPELAEKSEDEKRFDERVRDTVNAFCDDLTQRGNPPTRSERELIEIRIRANPHDYID